MIYTKQDGAVVTTLAWTPPTARVDGSVYRAADHAGYELGVSDAANPADGFAPWVSVPAAYGVSVWPLSDLNMVEDGVYEVALRTVDTGGRTSAWSTATTFTAATAAPEAPTGLAVS